MVVYLVMVVSMRQTCQMQFSICHQATKRTRQTRLVRRSTLSLITQTAPTTLPSSISLISINTPNILSNSNNNFTRQLAEIIMLEAVYHRCSSSHIHIHLNTPTTMEVVNKRSLTSPSPSPSRQTSTRTLDTNVAVEMAAAAAAPRLLKQRDANA